MLRKHLGIVISLVMIIFFSGCLVIARETVLWQERFDSLSDWTALGPLTISLTTDRYWVGTNSLRMDLEFTPQIREARIVKQLSGLDANIVRFALWNPNPVGTVLVKIHVQDVNGVWHISHFLEPRPIPFSGDDAFEGEGWIIYEAILPKDLERSTDGRNYAQEETFLPQWKTFQIWIHAPVGSEIIGQSFSMFIDGIQILYRIDI